MRAITGGRSSRSRISSRAAEWARGVSLASLVGSADPGAPPPPTVDSPSTTSTPNRTWPASRPASARARASISSTGAASMRTTGTVVRARPRACSASVASRAA